MARFSTQSVDVPDRPPNNALEPPAPGESRVPTAQRWTLGHITVGGDHIDMSNQLSSVFIGSSTEGLDVAGKSKCTYSVIR